MRGYGGNSSSLGYAQGDAIRNITGTTGAFAPSTRQYSYGNYWYSFATAAGAFVRQQVSSSRYSLFSNGVDEFYILELNASRQVPTSVENRPVNKAVRYLIRAKS